ncbi:MAG: metallophosphoesterase family protein [Vicinamibacterales bacterium]
MTIGALGDIHGDFASVRRIQARHPEVAAWLCVGDVAADDGHYEPLAAPVHFIKGNNDGYDAIASGALPDNLHFIENGRLTMVAGVRVAGLGGTFAPTWYDTASSDLPHPVKGTMKATVQADQRRHFVRQEVLACQALTGIDLLLTHEAPRPYLVGDREGGRGIDAGKTPINEVLAVLQPRLHLFGHHHRFTEQERQGVRSVGLDLAPRSYLVIDPARLTYTVSSIGQGDHP